MNTNYDAKVRARDAYAADSLADLLHQRVELNWLVAGWIERGAFALLVGAEGSFKSAVAIDCALSVAASRDWNGRKVFGGRVLYIAGEGRAGVIRRMQGWCKHFELEPKDVLLGRSAIELLSPDQIAKLNTYLSAERWALIVIDTLSANFGDGNENDGEDMGAVIKNALAIAATSGAAVLIVHHTPLDGREEGKIRPRGHSKLAAAADAIFTCRYERASSVVEVACVKAKDAAPPEPLHLTFAVVDLGVLDNAGNPITTVVLVPTDQRPTPRAAPRGKNQQAVIQYIRARANGSSTFLMNESDAFKVLGLTRQRRKEMIDWLDKQPWVRRSSEGRVIDVAFVPNS